jgi:hypothetical protein
MRLLPLTMQTWQGGMVGDGDYAAVLAQSASAVKKTQPAFQMHRDLIAAWNLWNVLAANYAGLSGPAYLKSRLQHTAVIRHAS